MEKIDGVNTKPFSLFWLTHNNFLPYIFTGILSIIGIITYFTNISTKVEVLNAQMTDFQQSEKQTQNLLNQDASIIAKQSDTVQKCSEVLGASTSAKISPVAKKTK